MFEDSRAYSGFAVDDIEKAKEFYGATLGCDLSDTPGGFRVTFPGGWDTLVYLKSDFIPATYTILNFEVVDAAAAVDGLNSHGVEMERYEGFDQDEKGIVRNPDLPAGAWFTDPAGNIICVHEPIPA